MEEVAIYVKLFIELLNLHRFILPEQLVQREQLSISNIFLFYQILHLSHQFLGGMQVLREKGIFGYVVLIKLFRAYLLG